MKKEEIQVKITSEEERLRVIGTLAMAGDNIWNKTHLIVSFIFDLFVYFDKSNMRWSSSPLSIPNKTQITIDALEQMLLPNYVVKDVVLSIEELKAQAEKLGFDLVQKPYEPKTGDFGVFWDDGDERSVFVGFLTRIYTGEKYPFESSDGQSFLNFRKLTEEEKQKIQEAW